MNGMLRGLWQYRGFILGSVKREFQTKYRNSLLGALWTVLNPLAMIVVYTVIFSEVMHSRLPGSGSKFAYSIFLCAGITTWGLFAEIVSRAQSVFIDNANLIKKLYFPRLCLPIIIVCSALVNFAIIFGLFVVFLLLTGNFPGQAFLGALPLLAVLVVFAIGLGITLGVMNVFFRDVGQFFGIFLTFWFWLTPIVYLPTTLPESIRAMLAWNPMYAVMTGFQGIFLEQRWPQWGALGYVTALALMLCALGLYLFRRHVGEMVDEL